MLTLVGILSISLMGCLFYCHKLKQQLRGYEHVWEQIESIADRNQDGSFTLDVKHLEEHDPYEVHAVSDDPSGIRLLELDGMGGLSPRKSA
jgi:hypothetical protein